MNPIIANRQLIFINQLSVVTLRIENTMKRFQTRVFIRTKLFKKNKNAVRNSIY